MKNDALSGPYTYCGTRSRVDCYKFELYDGPHRLKIKSATATRNRDNINHLVNGTGTGWSARCRYEVQSATFVLEKSSTITDVAMRTSGNFRDNTRHTVSRLIGIVGDGHERLLQDWTDAPSKQNCKISVSTSELFEDSEITSLDACVRVHKMVTHLAVHKNTIISVHRGYTIKQWTLEELYQDPSDRHHGRFGR